MSSNNDNTRGRVYKGLISKVLNVDANRIFCYWKGRVALFALLRAMGIKAGDEVILPGFTCVVVPNAILYLGAKPVYVDIERDSLNPSLNSIISKVTSKTKLIICQNTFGLSSQVDEIAQFASTNSIYTIEDCAHGFGGTFSGKANGTHCDAAFFSTQWNKPYSTGLGGFALINNANLLGEIKRINRDLLSPSLAENFILKILLIVRKSFLFKWYYWKLVKLYRWLSKHNIILGSSSGEEISSPVEPKNYFKELGDVQVVEGVKAIRKVNDSIKKRQLAARIYSDFLTERGKYCVKERYFSDHSFLRYPILVKDKKSFLIEGEMAGIEFGDWFNSPLHPIKGDLSGWQLNKDEIPVAIDVSEHIVNLPTDTEEVQKVIGFLERRIDSVMESI